MIDHFGKQIPYFILKTFIKTNTKNNERSLAGVAQWIESQPMNQKVAGSFPSQGTMPMLWARSPAGGM